MWPSSQTNIVREIAVDVSSENYTDENGFFVRCGGDGNLSYVPVGNEFDQVITKAVDASAIFNDPVMVKRIVAATTTATLVHVGYGV
jgi:hypothetical protein